MCHQCGRAKSQCVCQWTITRLYKTRSALLTRKFTNKPRTDDASLLAAIDRRINAIEMEEMRPSLERLELLAQEAERLGAFIKELGAKYGVT